MAVTLNYNFLVTYVMCTYCSNNRDYAQLLATNPKPSPILNPIIS